MTRQIQQVIPTAARIRRRRRQGAVLIDALIATFVVVVLTLGLCSLLIAARVNAKLATENNASYNAARQVIENVRLYQGSTLTTGDYNKSQVLALGAVPQLTSLSNADVTMTLSRWQDPATGTFRDPVKSVQVTVTWSALGGTKATKSRTFSGLVTPNGVVQ